MKDFLDDINYFKNLKGKRNKYRHRINIAYDVQKHLLSPYDRHLRNGDVIFKGKIIGNTHEGSMITGLDNINKIVFK